MERFHNDEIHFVVNVTLFSTTFFRRGATCCLVNDLFSFSINHSFTISFHCCFNGLKTETSSGWIICVALGMRDTSIILFSRKKLLKCILRWDLCPLTKNITGRAILFFDNHGFVHVSHKLKKSFPRHPPLIRFSNGPTIWTLRNNFCRKSLVRKN